MLPFLDKNHSIVVLLISLTSGCFSQSSMQIEESQPRCIESQVECIQVLSHGELSLKFGVDKIVSESSFPTYITYQGTKQLTKVTGYLTGKNMYMGKIPLLFKNPETTGAVNSAQTFEALGLVGSCTNKEMVWLLNLEIVYLENGQVMTEHYIFEFSSFDY